MWQSIISTIRELNEQWMGLTGGRRLAAAIVFVVVIGCLLMFGSWVGEKSYAPLYTDLQPEASIELVKILQKEGIPYLVQEEGKVISIPPEFIKQTLMKLAVKGIPGGNKPGMEIFDKESFGTSSYVQRINYVRALQGELTRTISTLQSVRKTSVHISMPPKSSFLEKSEAPKASVVVELHPGADIVQNEIKGIQNLVAFSVEGLRPERVTIVDNSGKLLSIAGDEISVLSSTMLERQRKVEKDLESRVESIIGRIVGQGNVIARVNAELDFDPVQESEKIYDPDQSAVKSEVKQENVLGASRSAPPSGVGAEAALQGGGPAPASEPQNISQQNVSRTNDRNEYEVSTKLRKTEKALGAVKRLTIAVLVNHSRETASDGTETTTPVSEEQKVQIAKLIRDAIGYVQGRDSVTVESVAFAGEDFSREDEALLRQERRQLAFTLIRYGTIALFIFFFFTFVVRPFIRWLTGLSASKVETVLPKTIEELEELKDDETESLPGLANLPLIDEQIDLEKAETELLKEKITGMIDDAPGKAAQIITDWILAESSSQSKRKRR